MDGTVAEGSASENIVRIVGHNATGKARKLMGTSDACPCSIRGRSFASEGGGGSSFTEKMIPRASDDDEGEEEDDEIVPRWQEQMSTRALVVGGLLGGMFCIITHKLAFTVGILPSVNIAAGLLGFFVVKSWMLLLSRCGFTSKPFTRQENAVIQTCVMATCELAFSGGFSTYLLAMDEQSYKNLGKATGNRPEDIYQPTLRRIIPYLMAVGFIGIVTLVPLSKVMIVDYNLTYPSGTATAVLINSFHTPHGAKQARKQMNCLGKYFGISFFWSFFKWFFSGIGGSCGFDNFPTFGLNAFANKFYFDFSLTYVGVGLICPHIVTWSMLLGGIVSWGFLWPLIGFQAGKWYPKELPSYDFGGLNGYRIFVAVALILGDGLYNVVKIMYITLRSLYSHHKHPRISKDSTDSRHATYETKMMQIFIEDQVPSWIALSLYLALAAIAIPVIPSIYPPVKWYYVLIAYSIAPVLAFCNAYGTGLTDWSLVTTYGKIGLFIFASWAGPDGGVIAGLGIAGVMMTIVAAAADLMQDFKTGLLTRSSPRSMFLTQLIGTLMGCILAPLTFWLFWTAFEIGSPDGEYKAPNATIFRAMAVIGTEGVAALPKHCLDFCYGFFGAAIMLNFLKDMLPSTYGKFIPIPIAMAIPFYLGVYFAIDMAVGSCILFFWKKLDEEEADVLAPAMASGLICGDGMWTIPSAILAIFKVNPPICMRFFPSSSAELGAKLICPINN